MQGINLDLRYNYLREKIRRDKVKWPILLGLLLALFVGLVFALLLEIDSILEILYFPVFFLIFGGGFLCFLAFLVVPVIAMLFGASKHADPEFLYWSYATNAPFDEFLR